jgi:mono/diheme cytochrome c family protein
MGLLAVAGISAGVGCEGDDPPAPPVTIAPTESMGTPPPTSGGTMLITRDGLTAILADTTADAIYFVSTAELALERTVALEPGDEPGRVVEGRDGRVHVVLRRGGAIATIVDGGLTRTPVCAAPRGIAEDAASGELHVACAGGELVTLSADLAVAREVRLERDLRDVVVSRGRVFVSQFRSATLLAVEGGEIIARMTPPAYLSPMLQRRFDAAVAWRLRVLPSGLVMMVHQRGLVDEIPTGPSNTGQSYYGGDCDQVIVHAAATLFDPVTLEPITPENAGTVGTLALPLDGDTAPDGSRMAFVGAGNERVVERSFEQVANGDAFVDDCFGMASEPVLGEPVALGYDAAGDLLVQTRQPASILRMRAGQIVQQSNLPTSGGRDWGHALFNRAAGPFSPIACASCHPEGGDDGRVWQFANIGARRTQALNAGVMDTQPFHWDGDLGTMNDLMHEVFVNRMGGVEQPVDRVDALGAWLQQLEPVPASPAVDEGAVARGDALFHSDEVGCAGCHGGAALTTNATVDVGTGKAFQVPSLRAVAQRAPFMHDGCAATLTERFTDTECGGGDAHGRTSHLTPAEVDDLVAYLESL